MEIIFRVHKHTEEEVQMGHKLGFTTLDHVEAISVSANSNGFTPLTAVMRSLNMEKGSLDKDVENCKKAGNVISVHGPGKQIILVPPTRGRTGKHKSYEFYLTQILKICNYKNCKNLHFAHYGFINGEFQFEEIHRLFMILLNPLLYTSIQKLYFEIDSRHTENLMNIYSYIHRSVFGLGYSDPQIIHAPEFEYIEVMKNEDGSSWREFMIKEEYLDEKSKWKRKLQRNKEHFT